MVYTFVRIHVVDSFWMRKAFQFLEFFFAFPFSPFLFYLLQWLTFYWACLCLKIFKDSIIEMGNFYHGADRCSGRKFWSEFFAQLFEHFCAYFRLAWADHSDLGIIGKIFFSCRSWVSIMPIWSKVMMSEGEERPRLVKGGYGRHRSQCILILRGAACIKHGGVFPLLPWGRGLRNADFMHTHLIILH